MITMKKLTAIFIVLNLICSSYAMDEMDSALMIKAKKLIEIENKIMLSNNNDSLFYYKKQFLLNFPNTFQEFTAIYTTNRYHNGAYSFKDTFDVKNGILIDKASDHILHIFNNLDSICEKTFVNKQIDITRNSYWYWDAVSYFWIGVDTQIKKNLNLYITELERRSSTEISDFWFFYLDSPNPLKEPPLFLRSLEETNPKMYHQILTALNKVEEKWEND